MSIETPQVGSTYVSKTNPSLVVYVVDVIIPEEAGENFGTPFIVEGCDPAYKDDTDNADGFELAAEVWKKHEFALVSK